MTYFTWETVQLLYPELLLIALAVCTYVAGAFSNERNWFNAFLTVGLGLCGFLICKQDHALNIYAFSEIPTLITNGPLLLDPLGHGMRWLVLAVGLLMLLMMWKSSSEDFATEYVGSLMLILAGLMIVSRAGELVLLFVGLELISIPTYIMLFIGRRRAPSHEATAKYFYLSILSSALLLYGFAFLYGVTGTTELPLMRQAFIANLAADASLMKLAPVALVLIFAGVGFKMAAVPFHFYAPDVYQGTTAANAGLLAVAPKIAGVVTLLRILLIAFADPNLLEFAWQISLAIAMITMTLGNVMALLQKNVRRMMAYSSIAHAGYLFIGISVALAVASGQISTAKMSGTAATLFYLVVYSFGTIGVFAALTYMAGRDKEVDTVQDLAGVAKSRPLAAFAMSICLFSLTGIPPFAGFYGKLILLIGGLSFDPAVVDSGVRNWFLVLVIVAAINAAISAGYYLRLIGVMYFGSGEKRARRAGGTGALVAAVGAAVIVVAAGIFPGPITSRVRQAGQVAGSPIDKSIEIDLNEVYAQSSKNSSPNKKSVFKTSSFRTGDSKSTASIPALSDGS